MNRSKPIGIFTIIVAGIVIAALALADSTAVAPASIKFSLAQIDWVKIGSILVMILGGGAISWQILIPIFFAIFPNTWFDWLGDKWGWWLTKGLRQKIKEENVDSIDTAYIRFQRAVEKRIRKENPDLRA